MSDNKPKSTTGSDEIDLGQLFQLIARGFNNLFRAILRFYLYIRKNLVILILLGVVGVAIGVALRFLITDYLKTEIIVEPNFDSKDYLYNVVEEIKANLKVKDSAFFDELNIKTSELKSLRVEIEQVQDKNETSELEDDIKYLEVLQNFQNNRFVADVVKAEIQKKSNMRHKITFYYKNALAGRAATLKLVKYIQEAPNFKELNKVHIENANLRILNNEKLIRQTDLLINQFSENLGKNTTTVQQTIILDDENDIDVTALLELKNNLLKDTEKMRLSLVEQKDVINVINFGKTQKVLKPLYTQGIFLIPLLLITLFFVFSVIKYLNNKAAEMVSTS